MSGKMAANGRVIPVHGRVVCGEHGGRVDNGRVTFRIDDPVVGNASLIESGKH